MGATPVMECSPDRHLILGDPDFGRAAAEHGIAVLSDLWGTFLWIILQFCFRVVVVVASSFKRLS